MVDQHQSILTDNVNTHMFDQVPTTTHIYNICVYERVSNYIHMCNLSRYMFSRYVTSVGKLYVFAYLTTRVQGCPSSLS